MSLMVTSVCLLSASSPVNIAWKYGLQAERMTRWAKIFRRPTMRTTSQSSRCLRRTLIASRVWRGCLSDVYASRAGDGGLSRAGSMGPIILLLLPLPPPPPAPLPHQAPPHRGPLPPLATRSTTAEKQKRYFNNSWLPFISQSIKIHPITLGAQFEIKFIEFFHEIAFLSDGSNTCLKE